MISLISLTLIDIVTLLVNEKRGPALTRRTRL
jgi:hypothetical protein